jgi:myo-inositol-1(or 4)-monophosphatase
LLDADISGDASQERLAGALAELGPDASMLASAALEAGATAMGYFRRDPRVWMKPGDSPVSEADIAADRLLRARLLSARPQYGWLSEETADSPDRLERERIFVVDPIDGTRAFIAGSEVWSVSVAVVENGRPVAAALYQPAIDDLMVAALGVGAWRGATRLSASTRAKIGGAVVSGPKRMFDRLGSERSWTMHPFVPSLALRMAYVADGRLDVAFASGRAHDWDLAAADLLVHEAGGRLLNAAGDRLTYNAPVPRHPPLVAAAPGIAVEALLLLAEEIREASRTPPR